LLLDFFGASMVDLMNEIEREREREREREECLDTRTGM
jgi:hypothetical protein